MKNAASLTRQEIAFGIGYLFFDFLLLPRFLTILNILLRLNSVQTNFAYFLLNFAGTVLIFHRFLFRNLKIAAGSFKRTLLCPLIGLPVYFLISYGLSWLIYFIAPDYSNLNDGTIQKLSQANFALMAVGTVVLVPPAEELLFRGLIFRGLYGKSPVLAYITSILGFSFVHVLSYLSAYEPLMLLMAMLQYVPAGICLALTYHISGNILSPILLHMLINLIGIQAMR